MSITAVGGNLVMVGLNTAEPQVFWNGKRVEGVTGVQVSNEGGISPRVLLKIKESPEIAEMQAAGVTIRKVLA